MYGGNIQKTTPTERSKIDILTDEPVQSKQPRSGAEPNKEEKSNVTGLEHSEQRNPSGSEERVGSNPVPSPRTNKPPPPTGGSTP